MDRVCVNGLRLAAVVGVFEWERAAPQLLTVNLEMAVDVAAAAARDDVAATVDYGAVAAALVEHCQQRQYRLIETLAEALAATVLEKFAVAGVRLELIKQVKVAGAGVFDAAVRIERGHWA